MRVSSRIKGSYFLCPNCGSKTTAVLDCRPVSEGKIRRRKCRKCNYEFATMEVLMIASKYERKF